MNDNEKLWVIDLGDDVTPAAPREEPGETPRKNMVPVKTARPARPAVRKPAAAPRKTGTGQMHFALRLVLTYLLGPFALLLWSPGRRNAFWTGACLLSGLGAAGVVWQWPHLLTVGQEAAVAAAACTLAVAFACWARALHLAFTSRTRSHTSWPGWMRSAWGVTGLGLLVPGLGLYLAGARARAVAVLWLLWPVALAGVIITHAAGAWSLLESAPSARKDNFEYVLAAAAGVLVLGYLGWLAQALAGLHVRNRQAGHSRGTHGDRYAAALLVAVVALVAFTSPTDVASLLHETSLELEEQGLEVLPLHLARTAHDLAPRETAYFGTLASLEWRRQGAGPSTAAPARHFPGEHEVLYGMMAGNRPRPAAADSSGSRPGWARDHTLQKPLQRLEEPGPM